jgi:hypothetical protein
MFIYALPRCRGHPDHGHRLDHHRGRRRHHGLLLLLHYHHCGLFSLLRHLSDSFSQPF